MREDLLFAVQTAALTLMLLALGGCNVVQFQQAAALRELNEAGLTSGGAEVGDATVHFAHRAEGSRTPVLLLHGFGPPALMQWTEQVGALEDRPIVMPDLLWFGGSQPHEQVYGLDDQVHMVAALLDHLGHSRVDVVGISYGGLVAYELATAHPDRVRRLVIVDSPGRVYTHEDHRALLRRFGVRDFGDVLVPRDPEGVQALLDVAYWDPPWVPDLVLRQVLRTFYSRHRSAMYALLGGLVNHLDALRARPDPTAPCLLVWGRADRVFPVDIAQRLSRRLGAPLEVIDEARHAPNLERPEHFNRLLLEFLDAPDEPEELPQVLDEIQPHWVRLVRTLR